MINSKNKIHQGGGRIEYIINKIHISVAILKHFVYFSIKIKQK